MESLKRETLLAEFRQLVASAKQSVGPGATLKQRETDAIVRVVRLIIEDGLEGSRAVKGGVWSLVVRVGRAFPLLLHSSVDRARAFGRQEGLGENGKADLWIQQALSEGVLAAFVKKVPTQLQIISAYLSESLMCDKLRRLEFESLADELKGLVEPLPEVQHRSTLSLTSSESSLADPLSPVASDAPAGPLSREVEKSLSPRAKPNLFKKISSRGIPFPPPKVEKAQPPDAGPKLLKVFLLVKEDEQAEESVELFLEHVQSPFSTFVNDMTSGITNVWENLSKLPSRMSSDDREVDSTDFPIDFAEQKRKAGQGFQQFLGGISKLSFGRQQQNQRKRGYASAQGHKKDGSGKAKGLSVNTQAIAGKNESKSSTPGGKMSGGVSDIEPGKPVQSSGESKGELRSPSKPEAFFQHLFGGGRRKHADQEQDSVELDDKWELKEVEKHPALPGVSIRELEAELISPTTSKALDYLPTPSSASTVSRKESVQDEDVKSRLNEGNKLVEEVRELGSRVLKAWLGSEGVDDFDYGPIEELCIAVEKVLCFGVRSRPNVWKPVANPSLRFFTDLGKLIPTGGTSAFAMLKNVEQMLGSVDASKSGDLGVEGIENMKLVQGDSHQLHAWLRSCLNAQSLGARIELVIENRDFLDGWYEPGSVLGNEDLSEAFASALKGLDVVKFFLAVESGGTGHGEEQSVWGKIGEYSANVGAVLTGRKGSTQVQAEDAERGAPLQTEPTLPPTDNAPDQPPVLDRRSQPPTSTVTCQPRSLGVLPRQKSSKSTRVVKFGGDRQLPGPIPDDSGFGLDPFPFDSFESTEEMSPTKLARILGMGGDDTHSEASTVEDADVLDEGALLENEYHDSALVGGSDDQQREDGELVVECDSGANLDQDRASVSSAQSLTEKMGFLPDGVVNGAESDTGCLELDEGEPGANAEAYTETDSSCLSDFSDDLVGEMPRIEERHSREGLGIRSASGRLCMHVDGEEVELLEPGDLGISEEDVARGLPNCEDSGEASTAMNGRHVSGIDRVTAREWKSRLRRHEGDGPSGPLEDVKETSVVEQAGSHFRSSVDSGVEGGGWEGIWKDIDVARTENKVDKSGHEYTLYVIEVMASDGTSWQVYRRFRDFTALRKALKARENFTLPECWENVKKARHVTGKSRLSPEIVLARSALIRQCLWGLMMEHPDSLGWEPVVKFLDAPLHLLRGCKVRTGETEGRREAPEESSSQTVEYGTTIKLNTELHPKRTSAELFSMQKGICAGCRTPLPALDAPKTFASYIWRSSGSEGPRKCEYTGLLYCHDCHQADSAVVPGRVLHKWDFTLKPVCVAAKDYLISIYGQPVLCLGAVNPGLFARVPLLANVQSLRQKVIRTLEIVKGAGKEGQDMADKLIATAGPYTHLLENPDFWALRDLIEISKGAFSELPRWLEGMSGKVGRLATSAVLKYND